MYKFLNKNLITIFFFISVLILLSAYFIEHVLGYEACNLCLIGRIPYFFVITFCLFSFFFKRFKKILLIFIFISFSSSVLIAFYHFGVEQGFFNESLVCQIKGLDTNISVGNVLQELENNNSKSCKNINFRIFGLSLATINLFISLVLSIITYKNIFRNEKNK
jgi:disulfide bond formation protein DsbB